MDRTSLRRLIAILDQEQVEDGRGLDIPAERYLALAAGARPTREELEILLASPLARDLARIAPAVVGLAPATPSEEPGATVLLRPARLAASTGTTDPDELELEVGGGDGQPPLGRLSVERGMGGALGWLLSLRLEPTSFEGGVVAGLRLRLSEPGSGGLVWLEATTDARGVARASWPTDGPSPRQRLDDLRERQLRIEIA